MSNDPPLDVSALIDRLPQFSGYQLLGQGGGGAVYEVYDRVLGTQVALKLCWHGLGSQDPGRVRERFFREFDILLRAQPFPHLVRVHSRGALPLPERRMELLWYTMERCSGSLHQALRTLTLEDRVAVVLQLLDGLSFLEARKVAHRDLKPHNVFLRRVHKDIQIKIGDFGIARGVRGSEYDQSLTSRNVVMGTPLYLAPEVLEDPDLPDVMKADQYAAGLVIYETLSGGGFPFDRNVRNLFECIRSRRAPPVPLAVAGFRDEPYHTWQKIQRMIASDPRARFRDLAQCKLELRNALLYDGLPLPE